MKSDRVTERERRTDRAFNQKDTRFVKTTVKREEDREERDRDRNEMGEW